jgi:hypothetical protein
MSRTRVKREKEQHLTVLGARRLEQTKIGELTANNTITLIIPQAQPFVI